MAKKVLKRTYPKLQIKARRRRRIRNKIEGTAERPRLCVTKTNRSLVAQLIDDGAGATLLYIRSAKEKTVNVNAATELGKEMASKAIAKGIQQVVFDRSGNLYHGRIAALANGAREGGLQF